MARTSILKLAAVMGLITVLLLLAGGARAQESTVTLAIDSIDTAAFPEITLYARALDATRRPIPGLIANDFLILEDGVQVPASAVKVESDTSRPLHLIFAIDTSVTPDTLLNLQQAMKAVVATLGPQDQVAIFAYSAQPNAVLGSFASNPTVLNSGIDALVVANSPTALNETVSRAVALARTVPTSQPAILLVTDGWDSQEVFPGNVTNEALAAEVPIYPITIGAGQTGVTTAQAMAQQTGGQPFILSTSNEIAANLQALQAILRQAYRVTYTSSVLPDNAEHGLTLSVSYQGTRALTMGEFTVVPTTLAVRIPGLTEGQQVSGIVPLTVQAVSPSPIVSVEYLVNDAHLEQLDREPYKFDWDTSTLGTGSYVLTVRAIDAAGNVGENRITLNIIAPLSVQATLSADRVQVGKDVTIEAEVETRTSVSRVEFLLDGTSLGSDDTAPYSYTFNSTKYQAASHNITVRAYDALGNIDETTLPIQFVTGSTTNWGAIGRWVLLLLGAAGIIGGILFFLKRRKKQEIRGAMKHCFVEIHNDGNVPSRYELRAEVQDDALGFHFALAGEPLIQRQETSERTVAVAASAPTNGGGNTYVPNASSTTEKAGDTLGFAARAADAVADVMSNVSYFLPKEISGSVMRMAGELRRARQTAAIASRLPTNLTRAATNVTGQKELPKNSRLRQGTTTNGSTTGTGNGTSYVTETVVGNTWTQTPRVEPGQTLVVDLFVEPLKTNATNAYTFQIISRSLEHEGAPLIIEQANVHIGKS
ncbi:MAG: VWA domain-containing protein [Ardenticatenales bacterium]|nr:VWA domain-containing protein [Ardenticatenales bacterium]